MKDQPTPDQSAADLEPTPLQQKLMQLGTAYAQVLHPMLANSLVSIGDPQLKAMLTSMLVHANDTPMATQSLRYEFHILQTLVATLMMLLLKKGALTQDEIDQQQIAEMLGLIQRTQQSASQLLVARGAAGRRILTS